MADRSRDVFINCAFDSTFKNIFDAVVFAVIRSGFRPRTALETDDASVNRFSKIQQIIEECPFGIHDISRTELDGDPALPRFNMPLELGVFLGAKRYGPASQKRKRLLILDLERYRFQRFISDLAGQDIHAHAGDPSVAIVEVASWLRTQSEAVGMPGGLRIAREYETFTSALPSLLESVGLNAAEVTFRDYLGIATAYVDTL